MNLRISYYDEPILRQKGKLITEFDDNLKKLTDAMIALMPSVDAGGLAAQQVGRALQLCVIDIADSAKRLGDPPNITYDGKETPLSIIMPIVIINPKLEPIRCQQVIYEESCVSLPGQIHLPIKRPQWVHLKYQDLQGSWHEIRTEGIFARCILHEFDHLQGTLIIDRAEKSDLIRIEPKLKKLIKITQETLKSQTKHS